ncbi:MAG: hypothetical protein MI743_02265 [Sneathiellales bacterium]|nr:hypothetical protein [Sneathiellales bacterium]
MAQTTQETDDVFEKRLCRVIAKAETTFYETDFAWRRMEEGHSPSVNALACVADNGTWFEFVPTETSDIQGNFRVVLFKFAENGPSAIGFVAWIHSHLRKMGRTGAIVICGKDTRNSDDLHRICQGALDYWACPVGASGDRFLDVIHTLIGRGRDLIKADGENTND